MKGTVDQIYDELNAQVVRMLEHSLNQAARIADLERQLANHKAARFAYASELPLGEDGEPDTANIQVNIRMLKRQLAEASAPAADTDKVREALKQATEFKYVPVFKGATQEEQRSALVELLMKGLAAQAPVREVPGWQPIETAPKDMASRLYLLGRYCVQGFTDAAGELMVQSEISPHWRKMRGKPTHWMPLPAAPVRQEGSL